MRPIHASATVRHTSIRKWVDEMEQFYAETIPFQFSGISNRAQVYAYLNDVLEIMDL